MKNLTPEDILDICCGFYRNKDRGLLAGFYWELEAMEKARQATQHIVFEKAYSDFYNERQWLLDKYTSVVKEGGKPWMVLRLAEDKSQPSSWITVEYSIGDNFVGVRSQKGLANDLELIPADQLYQSFPFKDAKEDAVQSLASFVQTIAKIGWVDAFFMNKVVTSKDIKFSQTGLGVARNIYPEIFTLLDHENLSKELAQQLSRTSPKPKIL